jgi:adenine-specific DNA-methyltransferase
VKLEELSINELIDLVKAFQSKKKYGLTWEEDYSREHFEFDNNQIIPILEEVKPKRLVSKSNKNINYLIEGDNFYALNILKYTHTDKIDFIYIDPPYNTGNKDFKYNDEFVDKDDAFRHSKWLTFMAKRLKIAKELLKDTGVIFVSIGEDEQANLKLLMDSVFGESNFIETFIWESIFRPSNLGKSVRRNSEYVLCYVKRKYEDFSLSQKSQEAQGEASLTQNNNKPRTLKFPPNYVQVKLADGQYKKGKYGDIEMLDDLFVKNGLATKEFRIRGKLKWKQEYLDSEVLKNVTLMIKTKSFIPYYRKDYQETILRPTKLIPRESVGDVLSANAELKRIFGESVFDYPKPTSLIKYLISICGLPEDAIILDFFAGSGTTGDAVLQMNEEEGVSRSFILVTNNENKICEEVTYPRIMKVLEGYKNSAGDKIEGKSGNLNFFRTIFLRKSLNSDEMKIRIMDNCIDLICFKEGIFDEFPTPSEKYKIFSNEDKILAIYNSFDYSSLNDLKKELDKEINLKKKVYVFTFDNSGLNPNDFNGWNDVEFEPIPQKILEIIGENSA